MEKKGECNVRENDSRRQGSYSLLHGNDGDYNEGEDCHDNCGLVVFLIGTLVGM